MRGYYPGESEHQGGGFAPPEEQEQSERGGRGVDWALGILLGIALGIAIVALFLFFGSEETIDAPSVSGAPAREAPVQTAPSAQP